jgi:hypothetical protein
MEKPMVVRTVVCLSLFLFGTSLRAIETSIHFDLPATSPAIDVTPAEPGPGDRLVQIQFNLSVIADTLPSPKVDQLVVQVKPLDGQAEIADYAPRTELTSRYAGAIEECQTREVTDHLGFSLDGAYSQLARANVGGDRGEKNISSTKFSRVAPLHVLAASGTTHRGRGVYFKLRADDRQVLEGDRTFSVTLRVPANWKGELVEFRVEAEAIQKSFSSSLSSLAGIPPKSHVVGAARFLVATYLHGDESFALRAAQIANAESDLRTAVAASFRRAQSAGNASSLNHVAFRFDLSGPDPHLQQERLSQLVERVIFGNVDPYTDPTIGELPVATRVAILNYLDARDQFTAQQSTTGLVRNSFAKGEEVE